MNNKFKEMLITQLEQELETAKNMDVDKLAVEVQSLGFKCLMCGKCCRQEYGDNRVAVIPKEIHKIQDGTDLEWEDIAEPLSLGTDTAKDECYLQGESGMVDEEGNIHTFGWMLRRKNNMDCAFIPDEHDKNKCSMYKLRPLLCSTYPFYIEDLKLRTSECEGIGEKISIQKSKSIAELVLKRYLYELQDTILTYKNYEEFIPAKIGNIIAKSRLKQGYLNYIVHNSEGTCKATKNI